jgi:hypothetical protein
MFAFNIFASTKRLIDRIGAITRAVGGVMKGGGMTAHNIALNDTKARFAPRGMNLRAQRAPAGWSWQRPSPYTMSKRKVNQNPNQAMVDTGLMLKSVRASVKETKSQFLVRIYVDPGPSYYHRDGSSIKVARVARLLENGFTGIGRDGFAFTVPPRPFSALDQESIAEINKGLVGRLKDAIRRAR